MKLPYPLSRNYRTKAAFGTRSRCAGPRLFSTVWMKLLMPFKARAIAGGILVLSGILGGCSHVVQKPVEFLMGEKVTLGPLSYSVIDNSWHTQLGDLLTIRTPQNRFLELTLAITNGGGSDVSFPLLNLENAEGQSFLESDNGAGVDNWLGLLRNVGPGQNLQGRILFDVPLTSYKLRLTDGAGPGAEKYGWVTIPLRMDVETDVTTPTPGAAAK